ncbi:MAG TPA: hypothetical protein VLV29_06645 [Steroidobacteraceae bacterium]|nr:hypothetical protein [Steroidobacteraceae bacterium]
MLVLASIEQGAVAQDDDAASSAAFSKVIHLDGSFVSPDTGGTVVRAFVLTRSAGNCLASFNESNNATAGTTMYCGVRQPSLFGGLPGIMLTIFFPGPVPDPLILDIVVHQDGAKHYGAPVVCLSSEGC